MRTTLIENAAIASAAIFFGIMAGFFWTYSININLAMLQVDAATYAHVQSLFNQNVRHPMFFVFFFGGGVVSVLAVVANLRRWKTVGFFLLALAALIYVAGVIVLTAQVNLPLNAYTESWEPQNVPADWTEVRAQWNQANWLRVAAAGSAFVLSIAALLGRSLSPGTSIESTRVA